MSNGNGATKTDFNRRDFLKIIGATTGLAAAGCGDHLPEKLIPYVIQPDEVVPGVASWYAGSCDQCSAGCGTLVRVREGRAVKVEGNFFHPVNRGGLCAQGQSTLQELYDPDRIREPLARDNGGQLVPKKWDEVLDQVANAVKAAGGKRVVLLTKPLQGSLKTLADEFIKKTPGAELVEFDPLGRDVLDIAAENTFGPGARVHFEFSRAEVIASFGADFLETWISPVEFSRGWASTRNPRTPGQTGQAIDPSESDRLKMSYHVHFEPRLSLTAANADQWVKIRPNSEASILVALLQAVLDKSGGSKMSAGQKRIISDFLAASDSTAARRASGIPGEVIDRLATNLAGASSSIVVAGGAATSGENAVQCAVLANLINICLGNVGKSVVVRNSGAAQARHTYQDLRNLLKDIETKKNVAVLVLYGINPAYTLSAGHNLRTAIAKVDTTVNVTTLLDETSLLATVVLPLNTGFESWFDLEPIPGVHALNQPSMQPLYQTKSFGDILIELGKKVGAAPADVTNFQDYIKLQWKKRLGESNFEQRWLSIVEQGGMLPTIEQDRERMGREVRAPWELQNSVLNTKVLPDATASKKQLVMLAFPSVMMSDGRSANRPWMQEVPDPITSATWGTWVEMHPDTAAEKNLKQGDVVSLKTATGMVSAPVYLTKYIHPRVVAVPLGQGHENYGRYATGIGKNALSAFPPREQGSMQLLELVEEVSRSAWSEELLLTQGSKTQLGRGLIRSMPLSDFKGLAKDSDKKIPQNGAYLANEHGEHGAAGDHSAGHGDSEHADSGHGDSGHGDSGNGHAGTGHHGPKYGPQESPGQMYKQMEHPLYRWAMTVDLATCTGCSACVVACYAENNIPVVGRELVRMGREMSWIRMDRYFDGPESSPMDGFQPMMCQHCGNAPCEPVCPVYATYHNEEGLNTMVYNRCVGTRYCSNNCSYKVRRYNWHRYAWPEPLTWQLNPDVTVREVGIMEKCTFCVQRIKEVQNKAKNLGREIRDGEIRPACASSCPTGAITFGNLKDKGSRVYQQTQSPRGYKVLDEAINTQPAVTYLARVKNTDIDILAQGKESADHAGVEGSNGASRT